MRLTATFFLLRSVADSLLKDTLSCRSHSMSLSFPLILCFHFVCPDCADFQQLYCIIYTDKRFPFNINVKFIANIMQKKRTKAFLPLLYLTKQRDLHTHRKRKRKQANRPEWDRRTNYICSFLWFIAEFVLSCMKIMSQWKPPLWLKKNERI